MRTSGRSTDRQAACLARGSDTRAGNRRRAARYLLSGLVVVAVCAFLAASATAANPSANLDQCANDPAPSPNTDGCNVSASSWINGNVGNTKSVYVEGDSIPYRLTFSNLTSGPQTVTIEWDTTKSGKHAIDYIDTFNQSVANANPCLGVTGCNPASFTTFAIPADPQLPAAGVTPIAGSLTMFGGTITGVSAPTTVGSTSCAGQTLGNYCYSTGTGFAGDKSAAIKITFTATSANPVLAWGGHIATRQNWGLGNSAIAISGSPYHTRLIDLNGSGGNQDRSLSAAAVVFPGFIHIVKSATGGNDTFPFTASPSPLSNFNLTTVGGNAEQDFNNIMNFTTYTVAEGNLPTNWAFDNAACTVAAGTGNGGTQTISGKTATINLMEGEEVTCTYANHFVAAPHLSITKTATESSYSAVGNVIHYSIVATNDGNVSLSKVTISDPNATGLSCTPANGSSLAPGASMTCMATHTIVQADLDAGHYLNQACVSSTTAGSNSPCSSVDTPASKLLLTKTATESTYAAVGDVIHYTIVATNSGQTTLSNVTVTDTLAALGTCTPANGSSLAPGASMTCTATHTITQPDLDAAHYANTACVSATGASQACASKDVPASKLSITKVATESSYSAVGDVIHYTIVATNTGQTTLQSVTVTDPSAAGLTCTPANGSSLAPGGSISCTASHTIVQTDLDAGHYANTACVDDGPGGAAHACASVDTPASKLLLTKTATESTYTAVGDVIHYTIVATNSGQTTLSNVTVSDPKVSGLVCTPANGSSLAPGASMTCTATHTITQADLDAGHYANTACVNATGATQACASKDVPASKLSITKVATESTYSAVGDVIHYTIVATNTGQTTLQSVTVTDANAGGLSCTPANGSSLAPSTSMTCTASHTIVQADLDAGHYANTACVDDGPSGAAQACASVDTPASKLSITKVATESTYASVGDVIHYAIVATNTGTTTLSNVTVSDPKVSGLVCSPANGSSLAPSASMTCTATHTIVQADLDAGHYANTACVDDGPGGAAQQCASANVPASKLAITKVVTESTYASVGDVIHYTIVATNTGQTTLTSVTVTDPKVSGLSCSPPNGSSLAPGASMTCTATHTIAQADLDAGHYANTACVDDGPGGAAQQCAGADVPASKLAITKVATESTYAAVGDVIHYTIVATNTGQTTLQSVTITDSLAALGTCNPPNGSSLAPGASMTCAASHTIVQADLDAGHYANTACVDDGPGGAAQACASADTPASKLSITKVATESTYASVGDVIHYTIVATNTGQTTLTSVTVSDPKVSGLVCTPANGSSLAPGASMSCTATHTIVQADLDAGHYANTACVDDGPGGAAQQCASANVPASKLAITKVATESTYSAVGDVIHYTIVATNTGQTTLSSVTATDPKVSGLTCSPPNGSSLAPGASMTCTASHTIAQADLDAGHYANTACVDDGPGGAAQQCAGADVPASKLAITKVATELSYSAVGDVIHYTIVATNTGQTTLSSVTVTDPKVSGLTCSPQNGSSLAPGASMTCTATHTIVQADLDAGHYANTACVDDGPGGAAQQCANADTPASKLTITKVATESTYGAVGDVIHYTIVATNAGQTTLTNVTVSDPKVSGLTCTPANGSSLTAGASMTCTATHTITQADLDAGHYANTACVNATGAAQACASANVPASKLAITKVATESSYSAVGDVIHYTIVATNTGQTTLQSVTITDANAILGTCTPANGSQLAPGGSITCTATHTIVQADLDAGHYLNTACVDDGPGGAAQQCAGADVPNGATNVKTGQKATITDYAAPTGFGTPTGTVQFQLFPSSDCSGTAMYDSGAVQLSNGKANSAPFAVNANGTYSWLASYSGDANNTQSSSCTEQTTISGNSPGIAP
jgi:uncharacterized repeat protein (TIGR01451 family)